MKKLINQDVFISLTNQKDDILAIKKELNNQGYDASYFEIFHIHTSYSESQGAGWVVVAQSDLTDLVSFYINNQINNKQC